MENSQRIPCNPASTIHRKRSLWKQLPQPLPELLEGEEVYEVETILKHQRRGREYQYYVKWKGYPVTEATWEHASAFSTDGDMLKEYQD
jgi:Chromo (CHRromatin Organisation MOdifier) domain